MRRFRIALDLDGVVYKWGDTARYLIRTYHGIDLGESTHWDYIKDAVPSHVWRWLWNEGVDNGLFRYGHLYRGAVEGVHALSELGSVEIVTHRPRNAVNDTLRFLAYLELPLAGVHILTASEPKSSVPADVYIDDSPLVAEELSRSGKTLVLVDRPWNSSPNAPRAEYVRAYGWGQENPHAIIKTVEMLLQKEES